MPEIDVEDPDRLLHKEVANASSPAAKNSLHITPQPNFYTAKEQVVILLIWTANNIGVNILNKACFAIADFQYPYMLSAVHMLVCSIAANVYISYSQGVKRKALDKKGNQFIHVFSFLFAGNIAVGNISLRYVSLNFNQVMRSLVPVMVMIMDYICFRKVYSLKKRQAVIPIVIGVALACYGEIDFTLLGFIVTAACVFFAAIKVVVSGYALTGEWKLHPVDLLSRMAPLAFIQMFAMSVLMGEAAAIMQEWETIRTGYAIPVVFFSGVTAFTLNMCSLWANKATSPLTLTIVANVKQVMMILTGTIIFNTKVTPINALGILTVILGSSRYSHVSYLETKE